MRRRVNQQTRNKRKKRILLLAIALALLLALWMHWDLEGTPWGKINCYFHSKAYIETTFPFPVSIEKVVYEVKLNDYRAKCYPSDTPDGLFWIGHLSGTDALENDYHLIKWKMQLQEHYNSAFPALNLSVQVFDGSPHAFFEQTHQYPSIEDIPDIFSLPDTSWLDLRFQIALDSPFQEADMDQLYALCCRIVRDFPAGEDPSERSLSVSFSDLSLHFPISWQEHLADKASFLQLFHSLTQGS